MTPKFKCVVWTSLLNSRLVYPAAYLIYPLAMSNRHLRLDISKTELLISVPTHLFLCNLFFFFFFNLNSNSIFPAA